MCFDHLLLVSPRGDDVISRARASVWRFSEVNSSRYLHFKLSVKSCHFTLLTKFVYFDIVQCFVTICIVKGAI